MWIRVANSAASVLGMKELWGRLEHLLRHSVEARSQVEAEVLAATRTDHGDVPETDPMDYTQLVVFGLGEDWVESQVQALGEVFEAGVGRGLQDDRVPCQEDAPGLRPSSGSPSGAVPSAGPGWWGWG